MIPFVNVLAHMSTFYYLLPTGYYYYYSYYYYFLSCVTLTQNDRRGGSLFCVIHSIFTFSSCILFYFLIIYRLLYSDFRANLLEINTIWDLLFMTPTFNCFSLLSVCHN